MKIICAPDSFKESLCACEVAQAMQRGITRADPTIQPDCCPIGDGGEGTLDAIVSAIGGEIHRAEVHGPLGSPVQARFGIAGGFQDFPSFEKLSNSQQCSPIAIVELAEASGLALVPPHRRDPTATTTLGTGQLIKIAMQAGSRTIIVCIGGSATVDGGAGIAQALGAKFWDQTGTLIEAPMTGGMLNRIARFEPPAPLPIIRVACDVTNPLLGPNGAAAVYGPQKGATPQQVRELDEGLARLAEIVGGGPTLPGTGAAGGVGFGLMAMCGAKLERGIDLVLDAIGFEHRCRDAALVLTGEGRLDRQSLHGKACMGVANAAHKLAVPTIAVVGSTGEGAEDCVNPSRGGLLQRYVSLTERFTIERAMRETAGLIEQICFELTRDTFMIAE